MDYGDKRTILRGPFKGFVATIRWVEGDKVECDVSIFGRTTSVTLDVADVGGTEMTDAELAGIEEEIARAARMNASHAYDRTLWLIEKHRAGVADEDLPRLDRELRELDQRLDEADRPLIDAAVASFRAAIADVAVADRATWWSENRERFTSRTSRTSTIADALGVDVEDREAMEAGLGATRALRERIELSRHAGFADDRAGTAPIAVNPDLEAAIDAAPDDDALRVVYGDWLQGHGDPRGELIAAQDGTDSRRADRLLATHERYLLGGLPRYPEVVSYTWRRGFLDSAKVMTKRDHEEAGVSQAALVSTLMALPSSRFLSKLTLGAASLHEDGVAEAVIDALVAAGGRPTLRTFALETDGEEEMLSWTETGPLDRVWPLYPNLTALDIDAGVLQFTTLDLPKLERLRIETCYLKASHVDAIIAADLTQLRSLELWFGSEELLGRAVALIESLPPLVELGILNTVFTDELVEALADSSKLERVELLDLSEGTLTDAGASRLARLITERKLPKLVAIDVGESYLTEDGLAVLRATGMRVHSDWQRQREGDKRYCATWE